MLKESFTGAPSEVEGKIEKLTSTIRNTYGKHYKELCKDDRTTWDDLFHFADIEKDQSAEKRGVLIDSLTSFLSFLETEYEPKG